MYVPSDVVKDKAEGEWYPNMSSLISYGRMVSRVSETNHRDQSRASHASTLWTSLLTPFVKMEEMGPVS